MRNRFPGNLSCAVLSTAAEWQRSGKKVALATVIATWGSSPRPVGSQLAVDEAGNFVGSVSGGCVEGAVIETAAEVIGSGRAERLQFGVADENAWEVGLSCGGRIQVYVEPFDASDRSPAFRNLVEADGGRPTVLVTDLEGGAHRLWHPDSQAGEDWISEAALRALARDVSELIETPGGDFFLGVYQRPLRLILVGAVHIAQELIPMARMAGFEVDLVDPRQNWASPERFPDMEVIRRWPDEALKNLGLDHRTALVTLSHDPKLDDPALIAAVRSEAFYVGALGSRRTHKSRLERLAGEGLSREALARIHGPVGLAIGARSPAEIAVSILAGMIARVRRNDEVTLVPELIPAK